MPSFHILPACLDTNLGWVVRTAHDNRAFNTGVAYEIRLKAQSAANGWTDLDEDWAKV
jgi:hypothetical protein